MQGVIIMSERNQADIALTETQKTEALSSRKQLVHLTVITVDVNVNAPMGC